MTVSIESPRNEFSNPSWNVRTAMFFEDGNECGVICFNVLRQGLKVIIPCPCQLDIHDEGEFGCGEGFVTIKTPTGPVEIRRLYNKRPGPAGGRSPRPAAILKPHSIRTTGTTPSL